MRLKTINEAARLLEVSSGRIRRGVEAGRYPYIESGRRKLVDVDELAAILAGEDAMIGLREAAALTGLSEGTLRRWARDGTVPARKDGKSWGCVPGHWLRRSSG